MRILLPLFLAVSAHTASSNEIGEHAEYKLNRSRARTSSIISAGSFAAKITGKHLDNEENPTYDMSFHYKLKIRFSGTEEGRGAVALPEGFFNGNTIKKLREEGSITNQYFKAKHLGREDITLSSNQKFLNCDKVELWDINFDESKEGLMGVLSKMLVKAFEDSGLEANHSALDDVTVHAYIHPDIKVVGAVRVDIKGNLNGFNFKMGFDFQK